ncbi:MAG: hypothetical protein NUV44_11750 [Candidatus Scalindua sp.]|nr:hypothetical protein [Candidatus Scalindua sp.]
MSILFVSGVLPLRYQGTKDKKINEDSPRKDTDANCFFYVCYIPFPDLSALVADVFLLDEKWMSVYNPSFERIIKL